MLTTQAKTALDTAIAAGNSRRQAAERNARYILANPADYPADMVADARIVAAPVVLKGVGA